jgi:hypothetical protein
MTAIEAFNKGYRVPSDLNDDTQGYEVTYPDGYKSWCPKDVFEASYYPIQDSNGEIISKEDVENFIFTTDSIKVGRKTTNTAIICRTGFEVHGQASCVNVDNYNLNIGEQIAKPKAIDVIWAHLGFVLQWAKYGLKPASKIPPHIQRMMVEHKQVEERLTKLSIFIDNNPVFKNLDSGEQERMKKQRIAMDEYFVVLGERINTALDDLDNTQTDK